MHKRPRTWWEPRVGNRLFNCTRAHTHTHTHAYTLVNIILELKKYNIFLTRSRIVYIGGLEKFQSRCGMEEGPIYTYTINTVCCRWKITVQGECVIPSTCACICVCVCPINDITSEKNNKRSHCPNRRRTVHIYIFTFGRSENGGGRHVIYCLYGSNNYCALSIEL